MNLKDIDTTVSFTRFWELVSVFVLLLDDGCLYTRMHLRVYATFISHLTLHNGCQMLCGVVEVPHVSQF